MSGQITKFMSPGWIVIFPVSLSIITFYFPFWCMEVYGGGWGVGLGSASVVIWFDVTFFSCGCLSLVLYQLTDGMLLGITPYLFAADDRGYISSGVIWGAFWGC